MTSTHAGVSRPRWAARLLLLSYVAVTAVVALWVFAGLSPTTPTIVGEVLGRFTATLAGAVCLGGLVVILIGAHPDDRGVLDAAAFRAHLVVERLSVVWAVTASVMVAVQAAADAGVSAARLVGSGRITAALGASETSRAWVAVAVCGSDRARLEVERAMGMACAAGDSGSCGRRRCSGYRQRRSGPQP